VAVVIGPLPRPLPDRREWDGHQGRRPAISGVQSRNQTASKTPKSGVCRVNRRSSVRATTSRWIGPALLWSANRCRP
jgi:hypothetical protein